MVKKTFLYDQHRAHHARMTAFAGWEMPLHYGSQIEEHQAVRHHAGLFDVSHMNLVEIKGETAKDFLRHVLANDVEKLNPGKALYSCLLNENGGVVDDGIVYMLSDNHYYLVLNASTKEKDLQWLHVHQQQTYHCTIHPREDKAILALQGPQAIHIAESVLKQNFTTLKPFHFIFAENMLAARTGYTGEDGLEFILDGNTALTFWNQLLNSGAHPAGLGARDSLRLEAGLHLYGQDMDDFTSPLESNLEWTVAFKPADRKFIGRESLCSYTVKRKFTGIVLDSGGILRMHQKLFSENKNPEQEIGIITSGGFSPVLNRSIGFARISNTHVGECYVEIRNKLLPVRLTPPVFVRKGNPLVS